MLPIFSKILEKLMLTSLEKDLDNIYFFSKAQIVSEYAEALRMC